MRVQNDAVYLRQTNEARFDIVFCCLQFSSKLEATRAPPGCQQLLASRPMLIKTVPGKPKVLCCGYQINPLTLSLFQLKDEPEGEGNRAVEEGSFWFEIG